jgi:hypothetical protein
MAVFVENMWAKPLGTALAESGIRVVEHASTSVEEGDQPETTHS